MSKNNTTDSAYKLLTTYVKRNRYNSTFDTNSIRQRLALAGVKPEQMSGFISRAVRNGLITKVGETVSTDPLHNSGRVGVYMRDSGSYTS